jgi:WhiB family redox-sensing transcriptional regulator
MSFRLIDDLSAGPAWMTRVSCRGCDPSMFFPERGERLDAAKAVCAGCVVRQQCLDYALSYGEKFGVWGGESERTRRRTRRDRNAAARVTA